MALLVLARSFHIGSAMLLLGILFFEALTLRFPDQKSFVIFRHRLARYFLAVLLVEWISGLFWLLIATSQMTETAPWYAISSRDLQIVLTQTQFGQLWIIRAPIAIALTLIAILQWRRPHRLTHRLAVLFSCALLISLAWAGHAGSGRNFQVWRLSADALHLATGAIWPLGLIPLTLFLTTPACSQDPAALIVVRRFSHISLIAVCLLIVTGIVNSWFLVGTWAHLFETFYGRLLLAKILLFALMIGFGASNRRLLRMVSPAPLDLPQLRRNIVIESLLLCLILGIVGLMGTSAPPH